MTTWPSVTWPSPPRATALPRRTERIVVPWNVTALSEDPMRSSVGTWVASPRSAHPAHEVARRRAHQEQERAHDRRRPDDLQRLLPPFEARDDVEERSGSNEIDAID